MPRLDEAGTAALISSNCVEVAHAVHAVALRDSKNTTGPVLVFGSTEWTAFLTTVTRT